MKGELGLMKILNTRLSISMKCKAKELIDADIVISQPFWPYYLTKEKMKTALKMAISSII